MFCCDRELFGGANRPWVILEELACARVSLCRSRKAGSCREERPDAPVVVLVCQQSPLLQEWHSGAPNRVALPPLCIDTGASGQFLS